MGRFQSEKYILHHRQTPSLFGKRPELVAVIHKDATATDILKCYFHLNFVAFIMDNYHPSSALPNSRNDVVLHAATYVQTGNVEQLIDNSHKYIHANYSAIRKQLQDKGWNLDYNQILTNKTWLSQWNTSAVTKKST